MIKKKTPTPNPTLTPRAKSGVREKISITIEPEVLALIDARGDNRSERITMDLTRYYRLLEEERSALRAHFSGAELSAIIDVQNGHVYAPKLYCHEISGNVFDGCRQDGLDTKWKIDGPALVAKIDALNFWQIHALADATERFWHAVGEGDHTRDPARALD